jgi:peptidoglycan hydrolase CwlO-like protein
MISRIFSRFLLLASLFLLVACAATVPQEEHDQVLADLAESEAQISELRGEVSAAEGATDEANAEIENLRGELDAANGQIADLQGEIASLQESVTALEGDLEAANSELSDSLAEVDSLAAEVDIANATADDAEQQRLEIESKVERAVLASDLLAGLLILGQSVDSISDAEAGAIFLDFASKVEDLDDEGLNERFDALILSEGTGEAETFELIFYLFDIIGELKTE